MYHRALREKELEVDRLTHELVSTHRFLEGTHTSLQESESRSEELLEEIRHRSTTSISVENQMYPSTTLLEDVGGLVVEHQLMEEHEEFPESRMSMERCDAEMQEEVHGSQEHPFMRGYETVGHTQTHGDSKAGGSYEDTFMCVPELVDIHAKVDPTIHLGHMMMRDSS